MVFYVDSKLPKDVTTITLSYTFFEVGGKVPPAPSGKQAQALDRPRGATRDGGAGDGRRASHCGARARCAAPCSRWCGRSSAFAGAPTTPRTLQQLNPIHVVIAGIVGAALFVLVLVLLVRWVVASGVAT